MMKNIAFLSMILDHIGAYFLCQDIWFRVVGRIAIPLFSCLVLIGMTHTRSKIEYMKRVLVLGIATQIFYSEIDGGINEAIGLSIGMIILSIRDKKTRGFTALFTSYLGILSPLWMVGIQSKNQNIIVIGLSINYLKTGDWITLLSIIIYPIIEKIYKRESQKKGTSKNKKNNNRLQKEFFYMAYLIQYIVILGVKNWQSI